MGFSPIGSFDRQTCWHRGNAPLGLMPGMGLNAWAWIGVDGGAKMAGKVTEKDIRKHVHPRKLR